MKFSYIELKLVSFKKLNLLQLTSVNCWELQQNHWLSM